MIDAQTQGVAAIVVFSLFVYATSVYRLVTKSERRRAEQRATRFELSYRAHRCPEPIIKTVVVERNHNPYVRQPWMQAWPPIEEEEDVPA